jgi:hypothetical protein
MAKASLAKRTAWTLLHLAQEPRWAPAYIRHNLLGGGRTPLELELPWFSYGAVDWLVKHADRELEVVEFGSGGSSIFFAQHYGRVIAMEHDAVWVSRVRELGAGHPNLEVCQIDVGLLADPSLLPPKLLNSTDIVVIDSVEDEGFTLRPKLLRWVESHGHALRIVILDDAQRYGSAIRECSAREVLEFQGLGPGRRGDTSTAILLF